MIKNQLKNLLFYVLLPPIIVYIFTLIYFTNKGLEPLYIIRDLNQIYNVSVGYGLISNFGILIWAGSAAINIFTLNSKVISNYKYINLIRLGSILSSFLCLDDLLMLHEYFFKEEIIYLAYIFLILFILKNWFNEICNIDIYSFITSIICLGSSLFIDFIQYKIDIDYATLQIIEEGFKFVGIFSWLCFWANVCRFSLREYKKL